MKLSRALTLATWLLVPAVVFGGSLYTFSNGTALDAAKLNSNFDHIHNAMVGGHGARLVNADVSASAAIAHSKLATPALVPKAWTVITGSAVCAAGTCTTGAQSGVTSIVYSAVGVYNVTLSSARPDTTYAPVVSNVVGAPAGSSCGAVPVSTTVIRVDCYTGAGVAVNSAFSFVLFDDN